MSFLYTAQVWDTGFKSEEERKMTEERLLKMAHRVANEGDLQELMREMRRAGIRPKKNPRAMNFLYISRESETAYIFPCDERELKYALRNVTEETYLGGGHWPGHGHGPEWRILEPNKKPDYGVKVLDLTRDGYTLQVEELKEMGVWSEEGGSRV